MWYELLSWLETRSGKDFDFSDVMSTLTLKDAIMSPYIWSIRFDDVIDGLEESLEILNEFSDELPSTLPDITDIRTALISEISIGLNSSINEIVKSLNMFVARSESFDDLVNQKNAMIGLIIMLSDHNVKQVKDDDMLTDLDNECGNVLIDTFNINVDDLFIIQDNIMSMKETFRDEVENDDDGYYYDYD